MRQSAKGRSSSMEHEVITAVVILYLLISGAMLTIHWLEPGGPETVTSSTSPSHEGFSTVGPADAPPAE